VLPPAPAPRVERRPINRWAWWAGGGAVMLLLVGSILVSALGMQRGFTLIVRNAPRGSVLYVDDRRVGVPTRDDTIRVTGLTADKQRELRLVYEGTPCELSDKTVTVASGGEKQVDARCGSNELPQEIDYPGKMVLIPAGEFIMGDNQGEPDEQLEHKVPVPAFYVDKFEVTNDEYLKFCRETNRRPPTNPHWDEQYSTRCPKCPVMGVTWQDGVDYAQWAKKRLPTEEEWEKAASWGPKATGKRRWPWGNDETSRANIGSQRPSPVGQYPQGASAYGVQDMAGNAIEWVSGEYHLYAGSPAASTSIAPNTKIMRGGSLNSTVQNSRTARRSPRPAEYSPEELAKKSWLIGFRCAVSADDAELNKFIRSNYSKK
jgi:formylglycine-generating enzyme required for sulfatase activity